MLTRLKIEPNVLILTRLKIEPPMHDPPPICPSPNFLSYDCYDLPWNKQERECYEYVVADGMVVHKQTGRFLDTRQGLQCSKWIFVVSTSKKLYVGEVRINVDAKPFV